MIDNGPCILRAFMTKTQKSRKVMVFLGIVGDFYARRSVRQVSFLANRPSIRHLGRYICSIQSPLSSSSSSECFAIEKDTKKAKDLRLNHPESALLWHVAITAHSASDARRPYPTSSSFSPGALCPMRTRAGKKGVWEWRKKTPICFKRANETVSYNKALHYYKALRPLNTILNFQAAAHK